MTVKRINRKQLNVLVDVYNALGGVVSEMGCEFFDQFYSQGDGMKMMNDFENVLVQLTPESFQDVK